MDYKNTGVGVIVARFQVAELTEGHKEILEYVLSKKHNLNIIFLGIAPTRATKNNPLDFDSRRRMLEDEYPGKFMIMYHKDEPSDYSWSLSLDEKIKDIVGDKEVVLYGSRDSFGQYYHGKYTFSEYRQRIYCSGTEHRCVAGKQVKSSRDWRLGCVYATQNRYPTVFPTVDCALMDKEEGTYKYIYLAKNDKESKLRFVGGFTEPSDSSYEAAAIRKCVEETSLEVRLDSYIGSCKINDWRYRSEEDKVITNFFAVERIFGSAKAGDDICELHRIDISKVSDDMLIDEHRPLFEMLKAWLSNK